MKAIKKYTIKEIRDLLQAVGCAGDLTDLAMDFAREEVLKVDPNHPLWSKPQYRPELDGSMVEEMQELFNPLYDEMEGELWSGIGYEGDD